MQMDTDGSYKPHTQTDVHEKCKTCTNLNDLLVHHMQTVLPLVVLKIIIITSKISHGFSQFFLGRLPLKS